MDAAGAKLIAARIRAGVRPGTTIELVNGGEGGAHLSPGVRGIVDSIGADGSVLVTFFDGVQAELDPDLVDFRCVA
jgi:hypothetical protein